MPESYSDEIWALIHDVFNALRSNSAVRKISTEQIAEAVYAKLDPEKVAPFLVQFTSKSDLRQRSRSQLRERLQKEEEQIAQTSLFELQDFYPTFAESEAGIYIRREDMTVEQLDENINRLRRTGRGYLAHADALEAWRNVRVFEGKLVPITQSADSESQAGLPG